MNWNGTQKGEGFEFHLLVLAMTVFLMIRGAGTVSWTMRFGQNRGVMSAQGEVSRGCEPMKNAAKISAPRLAIVLARCWRAVSQVAEESVREAGMCLTDFVALEAILHKGPLTITEIQDKIQLASGSMTAAMDRLEKKGFIRRTPALSNRRAKLVELTPREDQRLRHDLITTRPFSNRRSRI